MLAFLNVKTRRVILSPATYKPDAEWVEQQAEAFVGRENELLVSESPSGNRESNSDVLKLPTSAAHHDLVDC